jgi:hypothetical protein
VFLDKAREFLRAAQDSLELANNTAAVGNAVHAGILAADVISAVRTRTVWRGEHAQAAGSPKHSDLGRQSVTEVSRWQSCASLIPRSVVEGLVGYAGRQSDGAPAVAVGSGSADGVVKLGGRGGGRKGRVSRGPQHMAGLGAFVGFGSGRLAVGRRCW